MPKIRFPALDIMRGLTLALMILVNTPGSWEHVYAPLLHADWNGFTPTDFIFPFFLFMVGAALFFSQRSQVQLNASCSDKTKKILKRTLLIFLVGLFLNIFPFNESLNQLRILGVLQRIALAYGIAALLVLYFSHRIRWLISGIILFGYWALLQINAAPYSLENSLVRSIDLMILGENHLWHGKGIAFDPEGLLSTLPSVVNVLLGFECLRILSAAKETNNSLLNKLLDSPQKQLLPLGSVLIIAALVWDIVFPINKSLWTSPFVLLTSGTAILVLLLLTQLEKFKPAKNVLQVFIPFGKNPLFIYALSFAWEKILYTFKVDGVTYYEMLYLQFCRIFNAMNASLAFALFHVLLFWCVAKWLEKREIIVSL